MDWIAVELTVRLALATTVTLLAIGLPLASWLTSTRWWGKTLVEAVVTLPLLLPPTVLGFYLLTAFSPSSPLGSAYTRWTGSLLPFSFTGIWLASVLFNLPFAMRPLISSLSAVDRRLVEASWCLGVSPLATFWRVTLPLAWPGIVGAAVLAFAHTVGEFGVVLMVGGSIPGVTRTLSIAIYDDLQSLRFAEAGRTSLVLLLLAVVSLAAVQLLGRRGRFL